MMNNSGGDSPYTLGSPWNPYDRNVLKGDYPVIGEDVFVNLSATSDTLVAYRKSPVPQGVSTRDPGDFSFFGDGRQLLVNQSVFLGIDLFQGYTAYRPVDWLIRVVPAFNLNYARLREHNAINADVRKGDERTDEFATLQEVFGELHLGDTSPEFDIAAVRVGRQLFVSDFRGFIYNDVSDGARIFGNLASNRVQYSLALFNQVEKDTNSGLNEFNWRDQQVLIANAYVQDLFWMGHTTQLSFHWNHDQSDSRYNKNGVLVRPPLAGSVSLQDIDAYYLGWAGDGHIGRVNVDHALYHVFGTDGHNPIAGRDVGISAFLGAVELSYDIDWLRPKVSFLYASGDGRGGDGKGRGFDGILDNPSFAGGPSSFYNGGIGLMGVNLTNPGSFFNTLNSSKGEGQANFVNPGTVLFNAGLDTELTPKLRASINYNYLLFADTGSLEYFLNQSGISDEIGSELNFTAQWRPFLNNNIIVTGGASVFFPGKGFRRVYDSNDTLYQFFSGVTLTY
ncbi:MAG: hypothetical protein JNM07_01010 [Phycisphaerae bacterium]|nr:hypothetical protein [Phycisphaerae bacterium]